MRDSIFGFVVGIATMTQGVVAGPLAVQWSVTTTDSYPADITTIPGGGVYVVSTGTGGSGVSLPSLTRYSETGSQLWRTDLASNSRAYVVRSDAAGNAFIGGQTYSAVDGPSQGNGDTFLRKYNALGTKVWSTQVGTSTSDNAIGLVVGNAGDTFVLSDPWPINYATPTSDLQTELYHFASGGTQLSRSQIIPGDGTFPGNTAAGSDTLVRASTGELYAAFSHFYRVSNVIHTQTYLAKMDSTGHTLWVKSLSEGSNIMSMAIDASDNLIVADGPLTKFDPQGNVLWTSSVNDSGVYAVAVNSDGRIFAGGGNALSRPLVREYASDGTINSSVSIPLTNQTGRITSLAIADNRLYGAAQLVTGSYWSNNMVISFGSVPEPTSLMLGGFVIVGLHRRRRGVRVEAGRSL